MASIWATLRRFSSSWNFLRRIRVLRDFIEPTPGLPQPARASLGLLVGGQEGAVEPAAREPRSGNHRPIMLVFGFQRPHDVREPAVTLGDPGCLFLGLGEKTFERAMEPDCFVNFGARARPIGTKPDQLFHIRI